MHKFLKFTLGMKIYMFRTVSLSIIRSSHCTHSSDIYHTGLLTACEQDQDGTEPTRCTNFSNLLLEWNSTCFGQFLYPSSGVFHCTHSNVIWHAGLLTACEQYQDGNLHVSDSLRANYPKHVEFHSKNKFEKLVYLVGFIIRKRRGIVPRRLDNEFSSFL
jgi:hypothetical protein